MTATECLEHIWLKRRPKPQVDIKPVIVPQPKPKTPPPNRVSTIIFLLKYNKKRRKIIISVAKWHLIRKLPFINHVIKS